ncbi:MAG: DUF1631 family protein [Xanthomonadales bacterium]|nr:DUF1631 family protein [Xanthomonadales bacterium]
MSDTPPVGTPPVGTQGQPSKSDRLIGECRRIMEEALISWTGPAFTATCDYLFNKAETAQSTEQQNRMLAVVNILKKRQEKFSEQLVAALGRSFQTGMDRAGAFGGSAGSTDGELSLVEEEELEQSLAINDMANKAELRYTRPIHALNQRLTVLNRGRPVTSETNPVGPRQLGRALQSACQCLELESAFQVVLFKAFDRILLKQLGECYESLNKLFVDAGILPNIKFEAKKTSTAPKAPSDEEKEVDPGEAEAKQTKGREPPSDGRRSRSGESRSETGSLTREVREESAELIGRIRNLMERVGNRHATAGPDRPAAEPAEIDSALGDIQGQLKGSRQGLDSTAIRRRLDHLLSNHQRGLNAEQAQTVELMGMIYDYVRDEIQAKPVAGLLEQMQIPMLRVAMADQAFLEDSEHPARQFFNTIADAGDLWMDDNPEDSATFQKIGDAVNTVLSEYEGDVGLFRGLAEDLEKHIALLSRRAQAAEKRHVQARQGQEKLAIARESAQQAINGLVERYNPPEFTRTLLTGGWNDYLALLHLRHGEDSEAWKEGLSTAKYLAVALQGRIPAAMADRMRGQLESVSKAVASGLSQVGYGQQDIEGVLDRVEEGVAWAADQDRSKPQPAEIQESAPVFAHEGKAETRVKSLKAAEAELSETEKQQLARLRLTPFGTWFELQLEASGPWVKRKISWYSPVSGHCLMVNNHGQPEELDLVKLAKLMAAGRARRHEKESKPLLDRALGAVFRQLKRMAGGTGEAE